MKTTLSLLLVLLVGAPQETTSDPIDLIIAEERKNPKVMELLDHLVNKIGPRLTSSDRLTDACEWAKKKFEEFGLKNARLVEWGTFPVGFNRGPWKGEMTTPEKLDLTFITRSWTPGTKGPITGPAVLGPSDENELRAMKPKLKGAWVLTTGNAAGREFNDKFLAACDEAGVAGLIRSGKGPLIHTDGNSNIKFDNLPKRVNILMLEEHFKKIKEHIESKARVSLTIDIKNEFRQGPIKLYNVMAEIPGTEKPDEMVIVGGHIDSWDGATGTTDNGTGTVTTLEAARLLMKAGAKPKRTIRFTLWSGEEQGLLGSVAYVKAHPDELPKISVVLVHDGGTNYASGIYGTAAQVPIFEKVFERVKTLDEKLPFKIREVQAYPYPIGSDHDTYLARGVPGIFWDQKGRADYNHTHHTQFDTYDVAIKEYEEHTSMVVAIGALGIANLDAMLPREGILARGGGAGGRRMLGVQLDETTITGIEPGTAAEKAGLKEGDVVLMLDGKKVKDQEELRAAIKAAPLKTRIRIKRDGREMELDVVFEK